MRLLDGLALQVPVKWQDVHDRVKESREYKELGDRECEYLFDLYVRDLIERAEEKAHEGRRQDRKRSRSIDDNSRKQKRDKRAESVEKKKRDKRDESEEEGAIEDNC